MVMFYLALPHSPRNEVTRNNRSLNRQARHPFRKSSLGVEQPIMIISVHWTPLSHVFRHSALCWSSRFSSTPISWLPADVWSLLPVRKSSSYFLLRCVAPV